MFFFLVLSENHTTRPTGRSKVEFALCFPIVTDFFLLRISSYIIKFIVLLSIVNYKSINEKCAVVSSYPNFIAGLDCYATLRSTLALVPKKACDTQMVP